MHDPGKATSLLLGSISSGALCRTRPAFGAVTSCLHGPPQHVIDAPLPPGPGGLPSCERVRVDTNCHSYFGGLFARPALTGPAFGEHGVEVRRQHFAGGAHLSEFRVR